jgi:class 3 adenylate cyclase
MAQYDYVAGKKRVIDIIEKRPEVIDSPELPSDDAFTFENSYRSWVTGIFVDIRRSTDLFSNEDKVLVTRVIRSFTSEIIEIFRKEAHLSEIGIRGDCVYAIYTTPKQADVYEVLDMSFFANTYMRMLNILLGNYSLPTLDVGIGLATSQDLVIKAGRKDTGINNKVWIGPAVARASKFASRGNKDGHKPIVLSELTYSNTIDLLLKDSKDAVTWFTARSDSELGAYYDASLLKTEFNNWINSGMKED